MQENYELVQRGFRILVASMSSYIGQTLHRIYKDKWWDHVCLMLNDQRDLPDYGDYGDLVDSLDVANCLRIITRMWRDDFSALLPRNCLTWANELMGVRNRTAHAGSQDISQDEAERALDTMARLCNDFDLDGAKALLAEAGWTDSDENGILDQVNADGELRNLHLRFYYYEEPDNDVREEAVNIITAALAEVGIECKVTAMTMSGLQDKLKSGSFDLALIAFAMDVTPDPGFMLMSANVGSGNYCRYKSSKMDDLFSSLRKQTSQEEYRQKLMDIQYQFLNDCPFVCLYWRTGNVISKHMYTTCRDVREFELLRGIESFSTH